MSLISWFSEKKKKKKKTAVVSVNEEAHLTLPEKETQPQVMATVPVQMGLTNGEVTYGLKLYLK